MIRRLQVTCFSVVLLLTVETRAQEGFSSSDWLADNQLDFTLGDIGQRDFHPQPDESLADLPYRHPWLAFALPLSLTVGLTVGGVALARTGLIELGHISMALGAFVAPSAGHMYTGDWWRVLGFSLGRTLCGGIASGIFVRSFNLFGTTRRNSDGNWLIYSSLAGLIALTVYDMSSAPSAARDFNREARSDRITVAPLVVPTRSGLVNELPFLGLSVQGSFR